MRKITEFNPPVHVHIKVHEDTNPFCELDFDDVIQIDECNAEDAELYEEDFYDSDMVADRFGEYIILHFKSGVRMVYRKNEVDISWS